MLYDGHMWVTLRVAAQMLGTTTEQLRLNIAHEDHGFEVLERYTRGEVGRAYRYLRYDELVAALGGQQSTMVRREGKVVAGKEASTSRQAIR